MEFRELSREEVHAVMAGYGRTLPKYVERAIPPTMFERFQDGWLAAHEWMLQHGLVTDAVE